MSGFYKKKKLRGNNGTHYYYLTSTNINHPRVNVSTSKIIILIILGLMFIKISANPTLKYTKELTEKLKPIEQTIHYVERQLQNSNAQILKNNELFAERTKSFEINLLDELKK